MSIDYRNMRPAGDTTHSTTVSNHWWKYQGDELAQSISAVIDYLEGTSTERLTQMGVSARLYGNIPVTGLGLPTTKPTVNRADRVSFNVVQATVDTITAKMAKHKPRPYFLTSGGNYAQRRRAKKLTKFTEGVLYENHGDALAVRAFRDAAVLGTGCIHVFEGTDGRVKMERVLASELFVDEDEALYGEPRQLHRVKTVDRRVLMDAFPDARRILLHAKAVADHNGQTSSVSDMIQVRESWQLPSGPKAGDGKHAITIEDGVIYSGEWKRMRFPFAFIRWADRLFGFWGQGLAEQLQNIQLEINKLLWVVQRSLHMAGSFKILVERGSKIVKEHLNNDVGSVVEFSGTPPQYVTPPAVPVEIYNQIQNLKAMAFEAAGISQLSASSQKPSGLNSGKALREFVDIESDRAMTVALQYQQLFLDLANLSIDCVRAIAENDNGYTVKIPNRSGLTELNWKDVELDQDSFVTKCFPISALPQDPAGRLQTIQEYAQAGYLTPREAMRLLEFPDLEQVESLKNSEEEYLTQILEKIVDEGEYTAPDPMDDLALARQLAMEFYSQAKGNELEEERLEMLREFMLQVDSLVAMTQPPAPPADGPPQAVAAAPPVSDLLPNLPISTAPGSQAAVQ